MKLQGFDNIAVMEVSSNNVAASPVVAEKPVATSFKKLVAAIKTPIDPESALRTADSETVVAGKPLPGTGNDLPAIEAESLPGQIAEQLNENDDNPSLLPDADLPQKMESKEVIQKSLIMIGNADMIPASKQPNVPETGTGVEAEINLKQINNKTSGNSGASEISYASNSRQQLFPPSVLSQVPVQKYQVETPIIIRQKEPAVSIAPEKTGSTEMSGQNTLSRLTGNIQPVNSVPPPAVVGTDTNRMTDSLAETNNRHLPFDALRISGMTQGATINTPPPVVTAMAAKDNQEAMRQTPASEQQAFSASTPEFLIKSSSSKTENMIFNAVIVESNASKKVMPKPAEINLTGYNTAQDEVNIDVAANELEFLVAAEIKQKDIKNKIVTGLPDSLIRNTVGISNREALLDKYSAVAVSDISSLSPPPLLVAPLAVTNMSYQSTIGMSFGRQAESSFELNTGNHGWDRVLGKNMLMMAKGGIQKATIQMKPADLGLLNIQVSIQQDQLSVNISSNLSVTRELLESALPRLREQFSQQGFSQLNVDISDQQPGAEQHQSNDHSEINNKVPIFQGEHINEEQSVVQRESESLLDAFA